MMVAFCDSLSSCSPPVEDEIFTLRLSLSTFFSTPDSSVLELAEVPIWPDELWLVDVWLDEGDFAMVEDESLELLCVADELLDDDGVEDDWLELDGLVLAVDWLELEGVVLEEVCAELCEVDLSFEALLSWAVALPATMSTAAAAAMRNFVICTSSGGRVRR